MRAWGEQQDARGAAGPACVSAGAVVCLCMLHCALALSPMCHHVRAAPAVTFPGCAELAAEAAAAGQRSTNYLAFSGEAASLGCLLGPPCAAPTRAPSRASGSGLDASPGHFAALQPPCTPSHPVLFDAPACLRLPSCVQCTARMARPCMWVSTRTPTACPSRCPGRRWVVQPAARPLACCGRQPCGFFPASCQPK